MGILDQSNSCNCNCTSPTCTTDNKTTSSNSVGIGSSSPSTSSCSYSSTPDSGYCCNVTPDTIDKAPAPAPAPKPAAQCGPTKDSGFCNSGRPSGNYLRRRRGR